MNMKFTNLSTISLSIGLLLLTSSYSIADTINTDRPDFTESALSLKSGVTQFETGFTFSRLESSNETDAPETLVRYGITDNLEARIGTPSWTFARAQNRTQSNFNDGYFGFKIGLENLISDSFNLSLIPATTVPFGDQIEDTWNPELKICAAGEITDRLTLSTMSYIRSEPVESLGRESIYQHTISLGVSFTDELASFYEYALETYSSNTFDQVAHVGLTYLLNKDIQLDIHGGRTISGGYGNPFIAGGVSFRF
jgi:hypothetical protein